MVLFIFYSLLLLEGLRLVQHIGGKQKAHVQVALCPVHVGRGQSLPERKE